MSPQITVCIPVAPYHKSLVARAIQSVNNQTVESAWIYMIDENKYGAGYMRNRLLEKVQTPYVVFLDADDWLEPKFLEECIALIDFTHYVYTDWYESNTVHGSIPGSWRNGGVHLITSLLHTDMVRTVGGFDEKLPGMEDTDFYLKLMTYNYCGRRVEYPLVHYTPQGQRSKSIMESGEVNTISEQLKRKYNIMGCCGQDAPSPTTIVGERKEGDVKAIYLKREPGRVGGLVSSRMYGYLYPQWQAWVDPRDIQAQPHVWREVKNHPKPNIKPNAGKPKEFPLLGGQAEQLYGLDALAQQFIETGYMVDERPVRLPHIEASPDYEAVMELARQAYAD